MAAQHARTAGPRAARGPVRGAARGAEPESPILFAGIPAEAFAFYESLVDNNTRVWWQEHRSDYEHAVREPLTALLGELVDEFGTPHVFRPYRDARFSKDKSPIKDHQGAVIAVEDAIAYYVQISATGLMVAGGWYAPEGQQVVRYRTSVEGPAGAELERILRELTGEGRGSRAPSWQLDTNQLKTRPRGYDEGHPRIDLLRKRRVVATRTYEPAAWMDSRKAVARIRADWRAVRPLIEWLADFVGPATDPADER